MDVSAHVNWHPHEMHPFTLSQEISSLALFTTGTISPAAASGWGSAIGWRWRRVGLNEENRVGWLWQLSLRFREIEGFGRAARLPLNAAYSNGDSTLSPQTHYRGAHDYPWCCEPQKSASRTIAMSCVRLKFLKLQSSAWMLGSHSNLKGQSKRNTQSEARLVGHIGAVMRDERRELNKW